MKIILDVKKSVEENASLYFEKAKKAKKKLDGVEATLATFEKKKATQEEKGVEVKSAIKKLEDVKKHWYEKFRWFVTSEGYLVIGGRDATTNEIIIKKHTDKEDIVFHTDMAGSPFVVIKKHEELEGVTQQELTEKSIQEAASFTLIHSNVWKSGLATGKVFWVTPDQVSKVANQGEYMQKGSFMIRGKTTYVDVGIKVGAGLVQFGEELVFMVAPLASFHTTALELEQGKEKASAVAKQLRSYFIKTNDLDISLDVIIRGLPQGCQIKKVRKRKSEL